MAQNESENVQRNYETTYSSDEEKWEDENGFEEGEIADETTSFSEVSWQPFTLCLQPGKLG